MRYVFGLMIMGLKDPFNSTSTSPVVFLNGELPSTGLPAELSSATQYPLVSKVPGIAFTADPRNPVGAGSTISVSILDDSSSGDLGKIFLSDPSADYWQIDQSVITDVATSIKVVAGTAPVLNSFYYINNECVKVTAVTGNTSISYTLTIARGQLNSVARVHKLLPSMYSIGEDGSQDRILLTSKPRLENGFHGKIYLFKLGADNEILDYFATRVVTAANPVPSIQENGIHYNISLKFIEDYISDLKIGGLFKEVKLSYNIFCSDVSTVQKTKIISINGVNQGSVYSHTVAKNCFLKLTRKEAEELFNEPFHQPSSQSIDSSLTSAITQIIGTSYPSVEYQIKIKANGEEYIYRVTQVFYLGDGLIKVYLTFLDCSPAAQIIEANQTATGSAATLKEGWTRASQPNKALSLDSAPVVGLRLKLVDTPIRTFLKLAISKHGNGADSFDGLIGGIGAGIPQSFFNLGSAPVDPFTIDGNTTNLLELNSLVNSENEYTFDLSKDNSFKDFLTNEFVLNQLLLGQLQAGQLTLRCWLHEIAPSVTLQPLNKIVSSSETLKDIKVINLTSGINSIDLSPQFQRKVRFFSSDRISQENTQDVRIWRTGNKITESDLTSGTLDRFIRAFNALLGGSPSVYIVPISVEDFLSDALEFGDSITWSDAKIPTPTGLGISGAFFIIGIDKDFDAGIINLKLIRNNLTENNIVTESEGFVAPSITVEGVLPTGVANNFDITVSLDGSDSFNPNSAFSGLFTDLIADVSHIKIKNIKHNPNAIGETVGSLEGFGIINSYFMDGAETKFNVTLNTQWVRSGYVASDIIAVGSKIELPDRRTADANLEGALIESHPNTLPSGDNDFLNVSPVKSLTNRLHVFGA